MKSSAIKRFSLAILGAATLFCAACDQTSAQTPPSFTSSGDQGFDAWRDGFAARAMAQGRNRDVVARVLSGLTPDPGIIQLDQRQPEFTSNVWNYVQTRVVPSRINGGIDLRNTIGPTLAQVQARYGVDTSIVLAIWSIESNYGQANLPYQAAQALSTLAYEGRRRVQFEGYLLALMEMIERGYAGPSETRSSWAGALGQPQFMPDVYLTTAVDFDGDGRRDIWTNRGDIAASIAHYLQDRGWRAGEPVFDEVRLPANFDYALADGTMRPVSDWSARGVTRISGAPWTDGDRNVQSQLYLPAGASGPVLLLHTNFSVIRRYNASDRYALSVALIARGIDGRTGLVTPWPTTLDTLTSAEMRELQTSLNAMGHNAGTPDGQLGSNTRRAVMAFQAANGMRPDGFPTGDVLRAVRARASGSAAPTPTSAPVVSAAPVPNPQVNVPAPGRALRRTEIRELQRLLTRIGYSTGGTDGELGARTRNAIRSFERDQQYPVTGNATMRVLTAARRAAR